MTARNGEDKQGADIPDGVRESPSKTSEISTPARIVCRPYIVFHT